MAGIDITYTSGCPINQNRCSYSQLFPPEAARKKEVLKTRSIKTMIWDTMNDGNAVKLRMTESTTPQTKIGSRPQVIPLVRITITVVMIFITATVVEMAKIRIRKQYASMPAVHSSTATLAYPLHPPRQPPH